MNKETAKKAECPGCRGIGKIQAEICSKCEGTGEILIHSHEHRHGSTVHDHPHPHKHEHGMQEDVPHDHRHK
jgi:DnaJ-class molecular chaperone